MLLLELWEHVILKSIVWLFEELHHEKLKEPDTRKQDTTHVMSPQSLVWGRCAPIGGARCVNESFDMVLKTI